MKCPNCRCILPNNVLKCIYCGYEFVTGSAKTLTVEEYYRDLYSDFYYDSLCYNKSNDNFYNYQYQYNTAFAPKYASGGIDVAALVEITALCSVAALLLALLALII